MARQREKDQQREQQRAAGRQPSDKARGGCEGVGMEGGDDEESPEAVRSPPGPTA